MNTIFVVTPSNFGLTREEIRTFKNRHYELVLEKGEQLDEVCIKANWDKDYDFLEKDTLENKKECFVTYVDMLLNFKINYVLFADGWENSEECKILHSIADKFNVRMIYLA